MLQYKHKKKKNGNDLCLLHNMYVTLPRAYTRKSISNCEYSEVRESFRTLRILRSEIRASYDNDTKIKRKESGP